MTEWTFSTAFRTPRPLYRLGSPSRSSTASFAPVDAPDGTSALPQEPSSRLTSTSTVGLPLESRTSLALMLAMLLTERRLAFLVRLLHRYCSIAQTGYV